MQNDFSIAMALKARPGSFKLVAQFIVIEDLAVEDNDHVAIRADQRLIAALEIEDAQSSCAERDQLRFKAALVIRPTVHQGVQRTVQNAVWQTCFDMRIPEDSTHILASFFGQKSVRVYPLDGRTPVILTSRRTKKLSVRSIAPHSRSFVPTWT